MHGRARCAKGGAVLCTLTVLTKDHCSALCGCISNGPAALIIRAFLPTYLRRMVPHHNASAETISGAISAQGDKRWLIKAAML